MEYDQACKKSLVCEKLEIGKDEVSHDPVLEEGEFRKDEPFGLESPSRNDMVAGSIKLIESTQVAAKMGEVNRRQSVVPERGSNRGGTTNTIVEQSNCSPLEGQSVNMRHSTLGRKCSEKHSRNYTPSFHMTVEERHKQRKNNCFRYYDYHHVLKKIEKVYSERLGKLLLQQIGDRKEFNILQKKQEVAFFRKHACSYKVHYERARPTVRYHRIKLPKLFFRILREIFYKHIQSQTIQFVKRQINDRNKEKRIKTRWIFEATAGYLKRCFHEMPLTYSGFEMEESTWHVSDFSEGGNELKYLDMESLTTAIEAIGSSSELEESHISKECNGLEPILENLQSQLETNGGTKHGISVDADDEIDTVDSLSSQSNHAPTMEFSEKVGTQVSLLSSPQNEGENAERSCSEKCTDEALELAKAGAADSENTLPLLKEKRRRTRSADSSEGSCSKSARKFPHEFASNFHETTLHHEEPRAARSPSLNVEQADDATRKEVPNDRTYFSAQVTEQLNINASSSTFTQSFTQLQHCDLACQNTAHQYHPSDGNTCSVSTGLDSPGTVNVQQQSANQMLTRSIVEQYMPDIAVGSDPQLLMSRSDHTSSFVQVAEQRNINSCSSSLTQSVAEHQYYSQSCQTVAHQCQPSGRNISSVRTSLDSPCESSVQRQSANQTTSRSTTIEQDLLESGFQSDPFAIELSRLLMLRDLMTKRHLSERQKINLEREMAMAEAKRKYDDLFHNLEMETLQKKKEIEILQDKVCKQHILAEAFQLIHKASTGVVSCTQRGAPTRTMGGEPNQASYRQVSRPPASATMYHSPQSAAQMLTTDVLRQPSIITQQTAVNFSGRSATTLRHAPSGVMGTGVAYSPHLRAFVNPLPASRRE